jgi:putative component of toxin-antitoxin plasmid stabilization module
MIEVREYLEPKGGRPFADCFAGLNPKAVAKVATALTRMAVGVGSGVFEYRIDFGPTYRVNFGKDGERLVIVLDSNAAHVNWQDYKRRKKEDNYGLDT